MFIILWNVCFHIFKLFSGEGGNGLLVLDEGRGIGDGISIGGGAIVRSVLVCYGTIVRHRADGHLSGGMGC